MEQAIKDAAAALAAGAPDLTAGSGPLLEAWVALELGAQLNAFAVAVAVRVVTHETTGLTYDQTYFVRTSQRTALKAVGTSWLEITTAHETYEIHNSIQLRGISGATHEADVCVLGFPHAYPAGLPYAVVECKHYDKASYMPCNAVRALVAVRIDVPSVGWSHWSVLSTAKLSRNARLLGQHFDISTFGSVTPSHLNGDVAQITFRLVLSI